MLYYRRHIPLHALVAFNADIHILYVLMLTNAQFVFYVDDG